MSNDCVYKLRVVAKSPESILRLFNIMSYKDRNWYMYKAKDVFWEKHPEQEGEFWVAELAGDVGWDHYWWFHDYNEDGTPVYDGPRRLVTFPELCKELDFGVESWTEESMECFQQHAICTASGKIIVEDKKDYDRENKIYGFGDDWGSDSPPEYIYSGKEEKE